MTSRSRQGQHDNPHDDARRIRKMFRNNAARARQEAVVSVANAQAPFETAAEVLKGLARVFGDFEQNRRPACGAPAS